MEEGERHATGDAGNAILADDMPAAMTQPLYDARHVQCHGAGWRHCKHRAQCQSRRRNQPKLEHPILDHSGNQIRVRVQHRHERVSADTQSGQVEPFRRRSPANQCSVVIR